MGEHGECTELQTAQRAYQDVRCADFEQLG
jgi:hypothetical protein